MIGEAAAFADKAHKGAFRKGTEIPYITHPMETAVIVSAFTDDEEINARYYWGIAHALKELEDHLYFKEYVMLCRTVFGEDVISSNKDMMQGEYE